MAYLPVLAGSLDLTIIFVLDRLQAQLPVDPCDRQNITVNDDDDDVLQTM